MSVIDLNGIKEQIQTILENNNTTTSSVVDLSGGLATRITRILKINPERIPIQASFFPCMTVFISGKTMENKTIARTALTGKREAAIDINIAGMVFNPTLVSVDEDPGDEDIEVLMENAEEILRSEPTLAGKVKWIVPKSCDYFNYKLDEETHCRAGVLTLSAVTLY